MKINISLLSLSVLVAMLVSCASKKTLQEINTELKNEQKMGSESMGQNEEGAFIVQKKENLATYLLDLQREVYSLEQDIYGNKAHGNKGKYGVLEDCRIELRAKKSGKWEMIESPQKNILSKEEEKFSKKMGIDEKGKLVLLAEEELTARIKRFERYKANYEKQDEWFDIEIKACKTALNNK